MIQLQNEDLRVLIDPVGGRLQSLQSMPGGREYLWQKSRFPHMFPFVGRLFEKRYTVNGSSYPMEMHGFVRNMQMEVLEQTPTGCTLSVTDTPETRKSYPYFFCFQVSYRLEGKRLEITYYVENLSQEPLYCAVGGHPGFNVPLEEGLRFEDYALTFSKACHPEQVNFSGSVLTLEARTPYPLEAGVQIPLKHSLFALDALVLQGTPGEVLLSSMKGNHGIRVDYPQMPYVGFWQFDKGEPQFLCIEPWSALPGREGTLEELTQFPDMTCIQPGEHIENPWSITVW